MEPLAPALKLLAWANVLVALSALLVSGIGGPLLLMGLTGSWTIWATLIGRLTPWRLAGLMVLISLGLCASFPTITVPFTGPPGAELMRIITFSELHLATHAALLLAVRGHGLQIARLEEGDSLPAWEPRFSLRSLFDWTTATAVALASTAWAFRGAGSEPGFRSHWPILVFILSLSAVGTLLVVWATLGTRRRVARVILLVCTLLFFAVFLVWTILSCLVLRRCGYRLVWRGRKVL